VTRALIANLGAALGDAATF